MGLTLAIHLGFVLALFLVLPYSKMVHGVYRSAALLRRAAERNMKPLGGE
jgi:citrate/tricarballylate utilization protein